MIACDDLLDLMPEVVAGRRTWSPEEASHLVGCAECGRAWALLQAARTVGEKVAARVLPSRVGERVQERLVRERRSRRVRRTGWTIGLAAAASFALVVFASRERGPSVAQAEELRIPVAELDSLTSSELEAVYDAMDVPLGEGRSVEAIPPDDLTDQQLERVLRSLEG